MRCKVVAAKRSAGERRSSEVGFQHRPNQKYSKIVVREEVVALEKNKTVKNGNV